MDRTSFSDKERQCELTFASHPKWWHMYTPGKSTTIIFTGCEDFRFAMNLLARCSKEAPDIVIVAFAVMSNHIHIVLACEESRAVEFFQLFRKRLARYMAFHSEIRLPREFQMELKPIKDLKTMRSTIAYVNRNGYVADSHYTPFSYPWSSGKYCFNTIPAHTTLSEYSDAQIRSWFRGRKPNLPASTKMENGHVLPIEWCAVPTGMAMFRDAHHYFSMVSKNIEAYSEVSESIGDDEFLTDSEAFALATRIIRDAYNADRVKDLTKAQLMDVARSLHFDYHSSNGQIRRVLGLSQYEVDSLFPLSKKS